MSAIPKPNQTLDAEIRNLTWQEKNCLSEMISLFTDPEQAGNLIAFKAGSHALHYHRERGIDCREISQRN